MLSTPYDLINTYNLSSSSGTTPSIDFNEIVQNANINSQLTTTFCGYDLTPTPFNLETGFNYVHYITGSFFASSGSGVDKVILGLYITAGGTERIIAAGMRIPGTLIHTPFVFCMSQSGDDAAVTNIKFEISDDSGGSGTSNGFNVDTNDFFSHIIIKVPN